MTHKVDKFDQLKEQAKNSVPPNTPPEVAQETMFTSFIQKLGEYVTAQSRISKEKAQMTWTLVA